MLQIACGLIAMVIGLGMIVPKVLETTRQNERIAVMKTLDFKDITLAIKLNDDRTFKEFQWIETDPHGFALPPADAVIVGQWHIAKRPVEFTVLDGTKPR